MRGGKAGVLPAALLITAACAGAPEPQPTSVVRAVVAIEPQADWVSRIGDRHVAVTVLVAPGQEPEMYEPTPRQMTEVAEAGVLFTMGLPFEAGLAARIRASAPALKVVDLLSGIERLPMPGGHHHHGHRHSHRHAAGEPDPHLWLDPVRVQAMAATIRDALAELAPEHAEEFRAGHDAFVDRLAAADQRCRELLAPYAEREMLVFHPAFGYFAHRYGLVQVPIEVAGREPTPRELAATVERVRATGLRTVFVQPEFASESVRTVAEAMGGRVVVLNPLAADTAGNLEEMARAVAESFQDDT